MLEEDKDTWEQIEKNAQLPPPHLANYEWRYTRKSAKYIIDLLDMESNICCLGNKYSTTNICKKI